LHGAIALGVVLQLLLSLVMAEPPAPHADRFGRIMFIAHETVGLLLLLPVSWHWLWLFSARNAGGRAHLFPFGAGLQGVCADWRRLLQGELPPAGRTGGLAGLVHGLGLLNVTAMLMSGAALFAVSVFGPGTGSAWFKMLANLHGLLGSFMWVYLVGHVCALLLHERRGEGLTRDMFRLWPSSRP
jgi:hypothetical protein